MTIEQINKQIEELKAKKKISLQKEKEKKAKEQQKINSQKRKLENRVKYILGGWCLNHYDLDKDFSTITKDMREQDILTLTKFKNLYLS